MKINRTRPFVISGLAILLTISTATFMGCSSGDEGPDQTPAFIGTFTVNEIDPVTKDVEETYDIFISKVSSTEIDIDNFRFFVVPIRATVSGNNLTINSQSFTQGKVTIAITGSGQLDIDELTYSYTLTGYLNTTKFCVATRK